MSNRDPPSPNEFERDKPGTAARDVAEDAIQLLRRKGGVFVDAVRATRVAMVLTDPNLPGNPIVFANQSFLDLSGYSMDEVLGQQPYFMNGPKTDEEDARRFRSALEEDRDEVIETVQYRKDGSRFTGSLFLSAFKDDAGCTLHHFLSWIDVSRRVDAEGREADLKATHKALQQSEFHAQALLAELQHRVRNTLAVVRSIARRSADSSDSVEEMIAHFEGRLNAFARVQSTVSHGAGVDLHTIIEDELLAVATREGERLRILGGPVVYLQSTPAETIGLGIHELATNAVKYGALSTPGGRIKVNWERIPDHGTDRLRLTWIEAGLTEKPEKTREGFGHEMLLRSLPYQLGATTEIEFTNDGMCFTMDLPLGPRILAGEGA